MSVLPVKVKLEPPHTCLVLGKAEAIGVSLIITLTTSVAIHPSV